MKPMFSIIIPTHNGEKCLGKCLDSVFSQTYRNFEVLVIADACTDNTIEVAKNYDVRLFEVNYERDGLTRNVGLDHAQGEWILFLDHDDWWLHEYVLVLLKEQIDSMPYADEIYFSFIWKGNGYKTQSQFNQFIAVWCKCWKKSFIGDTRFTNTIGWSDAEFHRDMESKKGIRVYWDNPLYYYNYMYEDSINDKYAKGLIK